MKFLLSVACFLVSAVVSTAFAQYPVVQNVHTADPAPLLHDGRVYLYVGHDEDTAPDNRFVMREYLCFSSDDMVNWTAHGPVLNVGQTFQWAGGDANAAQVVERNGKFYYYVSTQDRTHPGIGLGVAVSDRPTGPFKDALGHALVTNDQTKAAPHSWDDLDPTVFIDTDGRAYLYWGNNACYFAEFGDDMISLKGEIKNVPLTKEAFGPDFEEAPWVYARDGKYYMLYASRIPESIHYATSKSPEGPWTYAGEVMDIQETNGSNHPGLIEFKGKPYLFYQTDSLPNGFDKRRSICIEPFAYGADGSIPQIPRGEGVLAPAGAIDPRKRVEAETMAWGQGIETAKDDTVGVYVTGINQADYIKIRNVDFGSTSPKTFQASVASDKAGGSIDIRLGSPYGRLLATLKVGDTGGLQSWKTVSSPVRPVTGAHDLYLVFNLLDGASFNFDWWKFE
jgi:arabinoxylan arabinofuranohydrolase